ncbi:hypothetical protein EON65_13730 [archaeon]|nr:MAG: hypothetical protein EON65_13730 [archaeon]
MLDCLRSPVVSNFNLDPVGRYFNKYPLYIGASSTSHLSRLREKESYGQVIAMKGSFAFVQSLFTDEQLYCGEREFYDNIRQGDKVAYVSKDGNRGPYVEALRLLIPTFEHIAEEQRVRGTVSRLVDRHRTSLGLIDLDLAKLSADLASKFTGKHNNKVFFRSSDVQSASLPRTHNLDVGDLVEFVTTRLHDSPLYFATDVKFVQSKRARDTTLQVQRMLEAGAVQELGVVTTVKNQEFGFIQGQDRKDEVYFKVDDVQGLDENERIKEGMEVEFFVITEIVKGKVSDRAVHLKKVKAGTVQLEIVVGQGNNATVSSLPSSDDDYPGLARLDKAICVCLEQYGKGEGKKGEDTVLQQVDLWQRCLPDELTVKLGDRLKFHTHFYRPEKLFFARDVQLLSYFPVGRDKGVICSLRENFGFISSESRRSDMYFRLNQVIDSTGKLVPAQQLKVNMAVSFDVIEEEGKLRAVRVQLLSTGASKTEDDRYLVKKDVLGVVVRTIKNSGNGLIKIAVSDWLEAHSVEFVNLEMLQELQTFDTNKEVTSLDLYGLPSSTCKQYEAMAAMYFRNIKCENIIPATPATSASPPISVFKLSKVDSAITSPAVDIENVRGSREVGEKASRAQGMLQKEGPVVNYTKEGVVNGDMGLQNDLEVLVDLYYERTKGGKVIAKRVRVTDEPLEDLGMEELGVVDMVIDKGEKWGHIRHLPSDEKLLWHGNYPPNITTNKLVLFEGRRRGGLRVATNLRAPEGEVLNSAVQQLQNMLQDGSVTMLLIDATQAVVVDVGDNKLLKGRHVHIDVLLQAIQQLRNKTGGKVWEKVKDVRGEVKSDGGAASPQVGSTAVDGDGDGIKSADQGEGGDVVRDGLSGVLNPAQVTETRVSYKAKYYYPTPRLPTALKIEVDSGDLKAGSYCSGRVHMLFIPTVQVTHVVPTVSLGQATKKQGVLTRHKFKLSSKGLDDVQHDLWSRYNLPNIELSEISLSEGYKVESFYCLSQEIQLVNEHSRDLIVQGDSVDFWALPEYAHYAFAPTLVPKAQPKDHSVSAKIIYGCILVVPKFIPVPLWLCR